MTPEAFKCLPTGLGFRLYHSQSGSFVAASCDSAKGRDGARRRWVAADGTAERELPLHLPYLKVRAFGQCVWCVCVRV